MIDDNAGSAPEGPRYLGWREPSLREAFVDGYSQRVPGTPYTFRVRTVLIAVVAASVLALLLPSIRDTSGLPTMIMVAVAAFSIQAYRAAQFQQRLGRRSTRAYAAAAGLIAAAMVPIVPFVIVSWLFGPSATDALLLNVMGAVIQRVGVLVFVVGFLASLWVVVLFLERWQQRRGGPGREAEIEAAIRREHDARARAQGTSKESA